MNETQQLIAQEARAALLVRAQVIADGLVGTARSLSDAMPDEEREAFYESISQRLSSTV